MFAGDQDGSGIVLMRPFRVIRDRSQYSTSLSSKHSAMEVRVRAETENRARRGQFLSASEEGRCIFGRIV